MANNSIPIKALLIVLFSLSVIWLLLLVLDLYNIMTAFLMTLGAFFAGYIGEQFLHRKN
jgi:uncharacterized membrane protein YfcA